MTKQLLTKQINLIHSLSLKNQFFISHRDLKAAAAPVAPKGVGTEFHNLHRGLHFFRDTQHSVITYSMFSSKVAQEF